MHNKTETAIGQYSQINAIKVKIMDIFMIIDDRSKIAISFFIISFNLANVLYSVY